EAIEARLSRIWCEVLDVAAVDPRAGFFDIGGDSILAVAVARRIAEEFAQPFPVTDLFKHVSVRAIGDALAAATPRHGAPPAARVNRLAAVTGLVQPGPDIYPDCVAVIGMSCHFPGAPDVATLWENLAAGRESIEFLSVRDGLDAGIPAELLNHPDYVAARSTIAGKAAFDAAFFKVTPRDAQLMDPQLRHLLEHSWRAVEDAGYRTSQIADSAVFMSAASSLYHMPAFDQASQVLDRPDEYVAFVWAQPGTLPTTISHKLGLKGASLFVHSNCSSSLTALASAHRHIVGGESKHALVGAATLLAYSSLGYLHQAGMHFSSDGHLRPFDAAADGMISGEGVAVLLLKNAADAIADGDHIYALLRGIALNNDGADKAGFYAPSAKGQAEVIERALQTTGIDPASISYVEAHGTGTRLGDPIEFGALTDVYRRHTDRRQFCGLGSIKSNFGHLDAAAGLAGCLKVMLSLAHARIPPTLHFTSPNPAMALEASPFHIVSTLTEWPAGDSPRRAAVSSFGIGGTNAHAIFEEWVPPAQAHTGGVCLLPLSARSEERLRVYAGLLASFLTQAANGHAHAARPSLASIAFTLQLGREPMSHRLALSATSIEEAAAKLQRYAAGEASIDGVYRGEVKSHDHGDSLLADEDFQLTIDSWIEKARYAKLLEVWVRGFALDWSRLYRDRLPQRVSLPTYPFLRQDYWLDSATRVQRPREAKADDAAGLGHDGAAPAPARRAELQALREQWTQVPGTPARRHGVGRVLCVADDEAVAQQIARQWRQLDDGVELITLWPAAVPDAEGRQVVRGDGDSYRSALSGIAASHGSVDTVVYALSLRAPANETDWREILHLIQGLLGSGLRAERLLIGAVYDDALSRCHAESWIGI
ncbi:beta-ketoacyl synthase N-terminal-like domain-containing protein, partial [Tahibacter sp.]|uniref:beta-ketoacyl synthase N-terminal-like domain-containing protein n=1 Tax=Tahibacter sp. TaxID=2056211 RepID=UPI0028C3A748